MTPTAPAAPDGSGKLVCPHPGCGKVFPNRSVLNRHLRVHTGEKPYICPQCGKGFSQLGNMTKHLKSHENAHLRWDRNTESKPFKCSFPGCSKSFTAKTSLQNHILSQHAHAPPRPGGDQPGETAEMNCLHLGCTQTFKSQQELRQHLYSYTPGLVAEYSFLYNTVLQFADLISSWEQRPAADKEALRTYAQSVKQIVQQSLSDPKTRGADDAVEHEETRTDRSVSDTHSPAVVHAHAACGHHHAELYDPSQEPAPAVRHMIPRHVHSSSCESDCAWLSEQELDHLLGPQAQSGEAPPAQTQAQAQASRSMPLSVEVLAVHDSISSGWHQHSHPGPAGSAPVHAMLPCEPCPGPRPGMFGKVHMHQDGAHMHTYIHYNHWLEPPPPLPPQAQHMFVHVQKRPRLDSLS